jgi:NAD(P)H dehydrogenase (quinone)
MGFSVLPPYLSAEIQNKDFTYMSPERFELHLTESLAKWEKHLDNIQNIRPLNFPGWNDWDENGVEKKA